MRVILNPAARGGAGARARAAIERELHGLKDLEIIETRGPGDAVELARNAVQDGVDIVVAAGGDGTIHEVADGLLQATETASHAPTLGILPIGTGNDFAKVIPGARTLDTALRTLRKGRPHPFDAALAEWAGGSEYFVNAAGTGVDVEVVRQIRDLSRGSGALVYIRGLIRALARYEAVPLRIVADGEDLSSRVMIVAAANGSCVGGSFRITPEARPDDGRLDLCIVEEVPLLGQLALVPRIVMGNHGSSRRVRTRSVREVNFEVPSGHELFFQLDGELREPDGCTWLRVTVQPARLHIISMA